MLLYEDHKSVVSALAFSPDGSELASGSQDGAVFLRDSGGHSHSIIEREATSLPVHSVSFAPDGVLLVGGAFGWHGTRRDEAGKWSVFGPVKTTPTTSLAMLDDHTIAVGTGDRVKGSVGSFELWDLDSGRRREPHFLEPNGVRAVAACPQKRMVAWTTGHRKVCVWEVLKPQPIEFLLKKTSPALALAPDGTFLAAAVDWDARVYDIAKRFERFDLKGHKGQVSAVAFSPDGETIATGSWDMTIKLWDAASDRERATFKWPVGRIYSLAFAPDGLRLAAGGDLGGVVVWDTE